MTDDDRAAVFASQLAALAQMLGLTDEKTAALHEFVRALPDDERETWMQLLAPSRARHDTVTNDQLYELSAETIAETEAFSVRWRAKRDKANAAERLKRAIELAYHQHHSAGMTTDQRAAYYAAAHKRLMNMNYHEKKAEVARMRAWYFATGETDGEARNAAAAVQDASKTTTEA